MNFDKIKQQNAHRARRSARKGNNAAVIRSKRDGELQLDGQYVGANPIYMRTTAENGVVSTEKVVKGIPFVRADRFSGRGWTHA